MVDRKDCHSQQGQAEWTETMLTKYDSLDDIAAGIGEMDEIDKVAGKNLLRRYQDILADIENFQTLNRKPIIWIFIEK